MPENEVALRWGGERGDSDCGEMNSHQTGRGEIRMQVAIHETK
jgi:hypothetical protein